jgi:hypothetical protein
VGKCRRREPIGWQRRNWEQPKHAVSVVGVWVQDVGSGGEFVQCIQAWKCQQCDCDNPNPK